jgi:polyisoprenoid-binding protein YceI
MKSIPVSVLSVAIATLLVACSPKTENATSGVAATTTPAPPPDAATHAQANEKTSDVPAGDYTLDKMHASLVFRVDHLGFSNYTARFKHFDAKLKFDPANLATAELTATVETKSLETDFPDPKLVDFNAQLTGPEWLDAARYPQMSFRSTKIDTSGGNTMRVHGDLTLHGVTKPITLDAKFNGGYPGMSMDPHARIGFSASGKLNRSDFGVAYGIPAPGTTMGVSDAVEVVIEAEFSGPPFVEKK